MSGPTVAGVILAGGRARRMGGGDKALLEVGGRPLIAHAIDRLAPQVTALALSANGPPERFARFGLPVLADRPGEAGPLAGVAAGMAWARAAAPGVTHLATAAADTPFFPADLVARLAAAAGAAGVAVARCGGREHNAFMLVPLAMAGALAAFLADAASPKVADWLARSGAAAADFPAAAGADPFFNVNTPDDLARARSLA